jgi:hypothetical protein
METKHYFEIPKLFVNEPNTIEININSTNRVVYRFYNGPVVAENICETIPPANNCNSQWTATAGTIQITTTTIKSTNTTDNSTKITGYKPI